MNTHSARFIRRLLPAFAVLLLSAFWTGCGTLNPLLLETKVNDPIMMNLLDNDSDLAQIEDGTGFAGDAATCPT
ncbi:hypothetical protein JXO52_12995 [bacterium]|nr:hypothetical protein [bacterium]